MKQSGREELKVNPGELFLKGSQKMFTEVKEAVCFFFPGRCPERRGLVSTGLFLPGINL